MYREVSPELLLALMSVKLEPLQCCSDGRWRSATRLFPAFGVSKDDVGRLLADGLAVEDPNGVVLSERGAELLRGGLCVAREPHDERALVLN